MARLTRFLYASRFYARKGAALVAEAVPMARGAGARFELVMAGDGPLLRELYRLCPRGDGVELVRLRPRLARDEYLYYLGWADVVLCPSLDESFGVVAFEAVARGKAVVATAVGAHPQLFGRGAYRMEASAAGLAEYLMHAPALPGPEDVEWVREQYGREKVGRELSALIAPAPRATHGCLRCRENR